VLTGEAAVTIGEESQGMVAGDMVNTASRLQSAAEPGTVLVGESTQRAAAGAIAFEEMEAKEVKGKEEPVRVWRALAVVARRGGQGRTAALEPPFVGRDEELRLLKEQLHATAREGKPRLVTIVGQAGIGVPTVAELVDIAGQSRVIIRGAPALGDEIGHGGTERGGQPYGRKDQFGHLTDCARSTARLTNAFPGAGHQPRAMQART